MSEESKVDNIEGNEEYLEETEDTDVEIEVKPKVRKPKTEKQMAAFKLISEKRKENIKLRQVEKIKEEEDKKKMVEMKIVKKAISIKKKEIKKQMILDEISDDEDEVIQKPKTKPKVKQIIYQEPIVEKPKFTLRFV